MLALPRIAAAEGGTAVPSRIGRPQTKAGATNNPFIKMLAALRPGREARSTAANSGPEAAKASSPKARAALVNAKESSSRSLAAERGAPASRERPAIAARPLADRDSGAIEAKAARNTGVAPEEKGAGLKAEKRRGEDAALDGSIASMLALAAGSAPAQTADKAALARQASAASPSRGDNDGSAMETLGSHTEKGRNGTSLTVVDMRLKAARGGQAGREASKSRSQEEPGSDAAKRETQGVKADSEALSLAGRPLAGTEGGADPGSPVVRESAQPTPQSFADTLASRLRDGAADIVRSAQIVLRDGDSGVIRLRLEPESLGGVKIELKMTEKQISGKIVVESDIAGDAFRSSLDALKDAFAESGFETTALEVEVRNGMASGSGAEGGRKGDGGEDGPYWSRSLKELSSAVPPLAGARRDGLLNVIV